MGIHTLLSALFLAQAPRETLLLSPSGSRDQRSDRTPEPNQTSVSDLKPGWAGRQRPRFPVAQTPVERARRRPVAPPRLLLLVHSRPPQDGGQRRPASSSGVSGGAGGGGKMAAAVGVRGRYELPPCSGPGWLLSLSALLSMAARGAFATTHWVVTEDGKIQQQVAARAPLSDRAGPSPGGDARASPLAIWLRAAPSPTYLRKDPAPRPGGPRAAPSRLMPWPSPWPPVSS